MEPKVNTITKIVFAIKQFCYGFETMNEMSDKFGDGSPIISFYINSIYQYIAVFYLLNKENNPMGGTFYKLLKVNLHGVLVVMICMTFGVWQFLERLLRLDYSLMNHSIVGGLKLIK